jgi:chaperonin cofactor prefoldin
MRTKEELIERYRSLSRALADETLSEVKVDAIRAERTKVLDEINALPSDRQASRRMGRVSRKW